jgi:uncharacterized damage-inducible protein DinB
MQRDERDVIAARLAAARSKLLASLADLDEAGWDWRPGDGRWSVRQTLAHVGAAQWSHLQVARRFAAGRPVDLPGFDLDAWNAAAVEERAAWSKAEVLADLDAAQQASLDFLNQLDDEQLGRTGVHPALGEVTVGQVLRVIGVHDGLHRRDIANLRRDMPKVHL